MSWQEYIVSHPAVLVGKPVVRGTRLSVDFLLGQSAEGWTLEQVLESYPQLTDGALRAVFAYAAELSQDEAVYVVRRLGS
jgi:uncharacterized protein (DUF433 family)